MVNDKLIKTIFFSIFALAILVPIALFMRVEGIEFNWRWGLAIAVIVIILWFVYTYNSFISLNQRVKKASSTIDICLKERFDLIPNLVETVKGYKNHEGKLIEDVTKLRSDYDNRKEGDIKEGEKLNNRLTKLIMIVESYPELKASDQFLNLQKNLSRIESELQAARRIYNAEVTEYNTKRYKFPSNLIAHMFHFEEKALFEIEEHERENVKINI